MTDPSWALHQRDAPAPFDRRNSVRFSDDDDSSTVSGSDRRSVDVSTMTEVASAISSSLFLPSRVTSRDRPVPLVAHVKPIPRPPPPAPEPEPPRPVTPIIYDYILNHCDSVGRALGQAINDQLLYLNHTMGGATVFNPTPIAHARSYDSIILPYPHWT